MDIQIGDKINRLTIIDIMKNYKYGKTYCKCICDCGKETIVYYNSIKTGATKSCGCLRKDMLKNKREDLVGKQFGYLKVLRLSKNKYANDKTLWECKCRCGNITYVSRDNLLRQNGQKSCGCINSKGNKRISKYLIDHSVKFVREFKIEGLYGQNGGKLAFDFAILNHDNSIKMLIEYDGEFHFQEIYPGSLYRQRRNDKIKDEYCHKNNITLLRINYLDFQKIEEILGKELFGLNNKIDRISNNISTLKVVAMYDLQGNFVNTYPTAVDAAKSISNEKIYSITQRIKNVCMGKAKSVHGYRFRYVNPGDNSDLHDTYIHNGHHRDKAVYQFDKQMNLIAKYNTTLEAEKSTGVNKKRIQSCANPNTRFKSASGYIWRYCE